METVTKKQKVDTSPSLAPNDAFHLLLLPELRQLIREYLTHKHRFFLARSLCRKWKEEEKRFILPLMLQHKLLDHTDYRNDAGQWEARRRLLMEWIEFGGLAWRARSSHHIGGYNAKESFSCYWNVPCPRCGEDHQISLGGTYRVEQPVTTAAAWIYSREYYIADKPSTWVRAIEKAGWSFGFTDQCKDHDHSPKFSGLHFFVDKDEGYSLWDLWWQIPQNLRDFIANLKELRVG